MSVSETAVLGEANSRGEVDFYAELTARNAGVIDADTQAALRTATVLVAGCGSIGGAAVEPLARLGVRHFLLADPGEYEVNNLNRQNATAADIGRNKAQVAAERIRAINPFAQIRVFAQGVTADVVRELTATCDVVVDGVDVTTMAGLAAKYLLHEHAADGGLALVTGWDMAGAQYVRCYDYRRIRRVFDGQITAADLDRLNMWQILQRLVPARYVPLEMLTVTGANLDNPDFSFPQLVYAADLFGAAVTHVVAQLLTGQPVRRHIYIDLHQQARPLRPRAVARLRRPLHAVVLLAQLRLRRRAASNH
jgi:hypothetical protein